MFGTSGVRGPVGEEVTVDLALDGIRVGTDAGWFLVRASGTEPLVRITAEARDEGDAAELFETAQKLVDWAGESA